MARSDNWRPWVWAAFAFNTLFASLFAILCWATYEVRLELLWRCRPPWRALQICVLADCCSQEFHTVIHDEKTLVPQDERRDWCVSWPVPA